MERSGKVLDMTRGKPVRMILAFAIPLLIGNVFQQVYSMADTMVAGYCLGDRAIAAIGAMSALYSLIISMSVGLNSGFAVVVTQSFGAHDEGKLRKAIGGMMVLDAAITVLLTGPGVPSGPDAADEYPGKHLRPGIQLYGNHLCRNDGNHFL